MDTGSLAEQRLHLRLQGRVQGVGFRPFVVRLARALNLSGFVGNDSHGVFVEIEGRFADLDSFRRRLFRDLPPLARIKGMDVQTLPNLGENDFRVVDSVFEEEQSLAITPDAALCDDCLQECLDPSNRRFGYAFTNCTNCGPRYSIILEVPYDRPHTTMSHFPMCDKCRAEYEDPTNRRYHAQPNACPDCGPRVWLSDSHGVEVHDDDPLKTAANLLREGKILAIKGLGGFHLACRADDTRSVSELRRRKGREAKPLAIMVKDISFAETLAVLTPNDRKLLTAPAAAIVLLPRRPQAAISAAVYGASDRLGLMLAYTPLHRLLLEHADFPLVMTSGNSSGEPLCHENHDAVERLGEIADAFLLHDRPIHRPIDDSVLLSLGNEDPLVVRRARGFVPDPIPCARRAETTIMALGGDLKSSICILKENEAVLSEHLGDLDNPRSYRNFIDAGQRLRHLLRVEPTLYACDLHPAYHSSRFARDLGAPLIEVQHHHAHVVSCMAENHLDGPVLGIACDGTGYGTDGSIWGGEILLACHDRFERVAHLAPFPLLGGDLAALESWRAAAGVLYSLRGEDWPGALPATSGKTAACKIDPLLLRTATVQLKRNISVVNSSSLGRLFDAASFLLGLCGRNRFEGEAAIRLETAAHCAGDVPNPPVQVTENPRGILEMNGNQLVLDMVQRLESGESIETCAALFHQGVCELFAEATHLNARRLGVRKVVLSGGCFVNRLLLEGLTLRLRSRGLEVYRHRHLPPGDGGLSLGQAVVAAARSKEGGTPCA